MQYPVCVLIFWFMSPPFNWKRYIWSFFPANSFMILTLKNNKRIDSTRQSLDLSLASAVMGGTDPRFVPILQPLIFLQSPLQLQPPRPSPRHSLLPTTINTTFVVGSLSPVNHELPDPPELFRKGQSCNHPPGQAASVGFLYISLSGLPFQLQKCGSQRYWENAMVPYISRRLEIRAVAESSSGTCRSCLKMSGVTALVPRKRSWAQRKPWIRSCCESASPGFCPQRCPPDFLKKCFLDHKVKFIKKDNHLTNSSGQPEAGLGETSLKCSPLSMTRSIQEQHLLKTCCGSLASGLQPESLPLTS